MNSTIKVLLAGSLHLPICATAQEYIQANGSSQLNGNPYYVLPKATILLKIPVMKTSYTIADYIKGMVISDDELKILEKKFGVDSTIMKQLLKAPDTKIEKSKVNEDSLKVSVLAKPDYTKIFYTDAEKKWNKSKSVVFTYGADGVLTEGESSVEDKTFDLAVKTLSGLTSIAGAFFKGPGVKAQNNSNVKFEDLEAILTKLEGLSETVRDKDIYKEVKGELEKKYAKLFAEYFYQEKKKVTIHNVYYTPKSTSPPTDQDISFFSLNPSNGNLEFNTQFAQELWGSNLKVGPVPGGAVEYKIRYIDINDDLTKHIDAKLMPANGFAYNIPVRVQFRLIAKDKTIYDEIIKVPQFGVIGRVYSNRNKLVYSLDPLTGELKKLSVSSSAISTDQVGSVGTAVNELITTSKGDSEAKKLEQEVTRLENEKKKRDLLKELNN